MSFGILLCICRPLLGKDRRYTKSVLGLDVFFAAVLQDAVKYRLVRYCKIYQYRLVDMTSGLTTKLGILHYGTQHDYTF